MIKFLERNFKKIIFSFVIIIILIVIAICFVTIKQKQEMQEYMDTHTNEIALQKMQKNVGTMVFYTLNSCIEKYYNNIYYLNNPQDIYTVVDESYRKNKAEEFINILNKEYIKKFSLDIDTILQNYNNDSLLKFIIKNIYYTQNDNNTTTYLVLGKQIDDKNLKSEDYGFILLLDDNNKTFSIAPYEFVKQLNITNESDISDLIDTSNIEIDEKYSNKYSYQNISEQELINNIFKSYKVLAKYDSSYAYELLDEDYKNSRFENENNAKQYLQENFEQLYGYRIEKYSKDESDPDYTTYICFDNLGNEFIIKKNDQIMEYSIILDLYTIPIEQYVEEYNKSSEAKKTAYRVELFKRMINLKDYNSAYNVLDKNFRENNFGSVDKFVNYINNNWYEFINMSYNSYQKVENVGTINVEIKNRDVSESEIINKTFIVKLNDDGTCTMSFNIE